MRKKVCLMELGRTRLRRRRQTMSVGIWGLLVVYCVIFGKMRDGSSFATAGRENFWSTMGWIGGFLVPYMRLCEMSSSSVFRCHPRRAPSLTNSAIKS